MSGNYFEKRMAEINNAHAVAAGFPEIKVLPLGELRYLEHAAFIQEPGVYFLWKRDELVYIGQSACIAERIYQHTLNASRKDGWTRGRPIDFDLPTALPVPWPYQLAVEAVYLRAYRTPENRKR
jgi:hypothetical protein